MESQSKEYGAAPVFRLAPRSHGKAAFGVAAVVAVSSFAFLVFGPLADQRALELAGIGEPVSRMASAPPAADRVARAITGEFRWEP